MTSNKIVNLNMDFKQSIVIETESLDWHPSPLAGVRRRMLEREGKESGRATSIVKYDKNSHFSLHTHTGGEEFLVLSGIFSDQSGDHGAGMYVRNPVGSRHAPYSVDGCTIFVKLGQMNLQDQTYVKTNTLNTPWSPGLVDGLSVMPLHQFGTESVAMVKWQPGTHFNRHTHPGGEEILVVAGTFEDEHGRYPTGTWIRNPSYSVHTPFSSEGCTIFVKTGHLDNF